MRLAGSGALRPRRRIETAFGPFCRTHWLFLALLAVAVVMRVLVTVAFRPGLELYGDSYAYLKDASHLRQGGFHPMGYAVFLRALFWTHYTVVIVAIQHLLGLLAGVATYVAVRRLDARPWLAAIASAPVLLDGYQMDVEQFVLSDTVFLVLILAACLLVLAPRRPGVVTCAVAGLLIAAATLTRGLGLAVLLPVLCYALVARFGWRRTVALGACAVIPVLGYMGRFTQTHHQFALESTDGLWLYGRTAYFASCAPLPAAERAICPHVPLSMRLSPEAYTWSKYASPLYLRYPPKERPRQGKKFAYAVIRREPLGYLRTTLDGLIRDVAPVRTNIWWAWNVHAWQMSPIIHARKTNTTLAAGTILASRNAHHPFREKVRAASPAAFTSGYQKIVWTPGPTLPLALLIVLLALVRRRQERRVWVAAALAAAGVLLMLVPALTEVQDYRYMLPVQALLWPAGALAADALLRRSGAGEASEVDPQSPRVSGKPSPSGVTLDS
ncbi:MAG TPA: hypothetical protein VFH66_09635 [Mycobacteriales bacterium]|nr:hypothetical protein [Mycobacteriales bacterium]